MQNFVPLICVSWCEYWSSNYWFELSKVDNDRWPRMTFYDILMKIGWNFIVGFYYVLKLFISLPWGSPGLSLRNSRALFFLGVEILGFSFFCQEFPEIRILWFLFPGLFRFLGNWTIQFFWVCKQKKRLNYESVFAIYEIDALKPYLYNNN